MSTQVGNFIHYLATFLAGLVVGFVSAWRLALLSIAVIPGIAFAGGLYAYTLTGLTSKSRDSYANAGIIAEQVLFLQRLYHPTGIPKLAGWGRRKLWALARTAWSKSQMRSGSYAHAMRMISFWISAGFLVDPIGLFPMDDFLFRVLFLPFS